MYGPRKWRVPCVVVKKVLRGINGRKYVCLIQYVNWPHRYSRVPARTQNALQTYSFVQKLDIQIEPIPYLEYQL